MRRAQWTCLAGFFVVFGLFCFLHAEEDEIPIEVVRLSDRVLVLKEDVMGNNITAIASKKGLVIVDTSGYTSTARKMRGIIEKEFNRTDFAFVISTHWHWGHSWGNQIFPEATIIGHEACQPMMERGKQYAAAHVQNIRRRLEEQKAKLAQAAPDSREAGAIRRSIRQTERDIKDHSERFVITPPQITFNDRMTLDLGDLTLPSWMDRCFFNERQFNSVGYHFLTMARTDDAITVFKMNVDLFPEAWNVYDSLAEACAGKGETQLAIRNYERSLELNPDNQNAKDRLKNLKKSQKDK